MFWRVGVPLMLLAQAAGGGKGRGFAGVGVLWSNRSRIGGWSGFGAEVRDSAGTTRAGSLPGRLSSTSVAGAFSAFVSTSETGCGCGDGSPE